MTQLILQEVGAECARAVSLGYTPEHDDALGHAHLVAEAHYRLGHMGEVASPAAVRATLVESAGLLVNAIASLDRTTEPETHGD